MAEALAAQGAEVIVTARRKDAAEAVCGKIIEAGGKAHPMVLDVSKLNTIAGFRAQLHEAVGTIDILINNAGVVFGGPFEKVDIKDHLNTYTINTLGLVVITHEFMGDLLTSRRGHLVNIASASAYVGLPLGSTYASSKWAALGFSESIRLELRERGYDNIHVTTVCPSYIDTGMFKGVKAPLFAPILAPEKVVEAILEAVRRKRPLVQLPGIIKWLDLFKGILPLWVWDRVAKITGISTSMSKWRGKAG
jgi:short-subunit dehydrogenase